MDGRGRAGGDGAGCCDVGCAANGGEHGGGLAAGVGAVWTVVVLADAATWDGALELQGGDAVPLHQAGGEIGRLC